MKKLITLSLTLIMMLCCFSGCTEQVIVNEYLIDDPADLGPVKPPITTTTSYTPPTTTTSWYVPPPTTSHYRTSTSDIKKEPVYSHEVVVTGWSGNDPRPKTNAEKEYIERLQQRHDTKITFKYIEDKNEYYNTFAATTLAGQHFGDIVSLPSDLGFPSAAINGYARSIDDCFYFDHPDAEAVFADTYVNDKLLLKGKRYYMANDIDYPKTQIKGIAFNEKLFEQFEVANPHIYIAGHNWILKSFKEVCKQMTRVHEGVQYYGYIGNPIMLESHNLSAVVQVSEGEYKFNLNERNIISLTNFARELYSSGYAPKENAEQLWEEGRVAMKLHISDPFSFKKGISYAYYPGKSYDDGYVHTSTVIPLYIFPTTIKESDLQRTCEVYIDLYKPQSWRNKNVLDNHSYYSKKLVNDAISDLRWDLQSWQISYPYIEQNILSTDFGISEGKTSKEFINSVKDKAQQDIDKVWEKYSDLPEKEPEEEKEE
ncbi:MAG: hypothetical protein IJN65_00270 [Clostridia bacterium]|nr:hypothetical protein [Clostridia bacterium]